MRKHSRIAFCVSVLVVFAGFSAVGRADQESPKPEAKTEPTKKEPAKKAVSQKETFAVIEIRGEIRVVGSSEIAAIEKELAAEHREALAEYRRAKKDAAKSKTRFRARQPIKPRVRIVARRFAAEDAAEEPSPSTSGSWRCYEP